MALSDSHLSALRSAVADLRSALVGTYDKPGGDFYAQLQGVYGIQPDGTATDLAAMPHLSEEDRAVAQQLRDRIALLAETDGDGSKKARAAATARVAREQAFTFVNRLLALRLAEARGLIQESVAKGMGSAGFELFEQVSAPLDGQYDRYRLYLRLLFDQLALDLPPLFDRFAPTGLLFPREKALDVLLGVLARPELAGVWDSDETIGWTYQFFNSKDEIRAMRKAGKSGPRDSREMAVRNQFFTPHYVVQFLVDNTLGRVWVEMTKGHTALPDALDYYSPRPDERFLAEGERVDDPVEGATYVPHRPLKDPREIRLLDPACGSMHFGLYAFDVFERIYLDAWDHHPDLLADLRETHDRESFRKLVPRLVLERNLHGVDIDPRALQIAGLALWLRAQRTWAALNVPAAERPRIRRSHLVCAEPMPGGPDLLDELRGDLLKRYPANGALLGELVAEVWDHMALAGEAGPLLKIEQELDGAIERARKAAETARQGEMFGDGADDEPEFSVEGVSRRFFYGEGPLPKVLAALHDLATAGEGTDGYRRRLFEEDAAQGLALVELLRQRYDVVVMNPPFGDPSVGSKGYIEDAYTDTKNDVLQAFVERAGELLVPGGYLGAITSRTPFFLSKAQAWRERVALRLFRPQLLADFGMGVLDAMVETAAYVFRSLTEEEDRALTLSLVPDLVRVERTNKGTFSIPKYNKTRQESLKRHQAERELDRLREAGLIYESSAGRGRSFELAHNAIKRAQTERPVSGPSPHLLCFRLIGETQRAAALLESITVEDDSRRFEADPATFADVPGTPFAYWVSDRVRRLFKELPAFEGDGRTPKQGLATADDFRFLRCWWEVPGARRSRPDDHPEEWSGPYCVRDRRWFPFAKGGSYSPQYADLYLVVDWDLDGAAMRQYVIQQYPYLKGNSDYVVKNSEYYLRPGLTWPLRTNGLSFRAMPSGTVFGHKGPAVLFDTANGDLMLAAGALANSQAFGILTGTMVARVDLAQSFEVGLISTVPMPELAKVPETVVDASRESHDIKAQQATAADTKHPFYSPSLLINPGDALTERAEAAVAKGDEDATRLVHLQRQIDQAAYDLYDFPVEDRRALPSAEPVEANPEDDEDAEESTVDAEALVHDLISYALGVALGRWDVRYATGDREPPPLPDPFAPLPVCPPGMLQDDATGLPLDAPPPGYPVPFPPSGLVADDLTDEAAEDGLLTRVRHVFGLLFPGRADAIEAEAADLLGASSLADYLRRPSSFFDAHLKRYTKSRRKAPIYWPLTTPSGLYTLWLYYPRLSEQTLYAAVQDHVVPKLEAVEGDLARFKASAGALSKEDRDRQDDLATLRQELLDLRDALLAVTRLPYRPSLDDGVELCAAPLSALFAHTKWRQHLEKRWDELEAGDYDWAHLARAVWPARVEEKARTDKSLAIAHGLDQQTTT